MKINLSRKELEKTYALLDTKEINMSIADLLFSTFEEKEFFKGAKSSQDYYQKLIRFFNIPSDNLEELEILEKWVKPAIFPLNHEFFTKNLYYNTIKPKPFKRDNYELSYIDFKAYQPFSLNDIEIDENDNYLERSPLSYFTNDESYLALSYKGEVWMSITPNEINTMSPYIKEASGRVIVLGLGLGYYPFMISEKETVEQITIVELDQNIIDIFNQHLLPLFPHKEKIKIIKGDAIKFLENNKDHYQYVFADLWHNAYDGLPLYLRLKQLEKKNTGCKFQYWLEKSLIALLRRCLLSVYEESLQGYTDDDYLKAHDDIDKVINDLYFKTKNITISSYDDIYRLLTDESILRLI